MASDDGDAARPARQGRGGLRPPRGAAATADVAEHHDVRPIDPLVEQSMRRPKPQAVPEAPAGANGNGHGSSNGDGSRRRTRAAATPVPAQPRAKRAKARGGQRRSSSPAAAAPVEPETVDAAAVAPEAAVDAPSEAPVEAPAPVDESAAETGVTEAVVTVEPPVVEEPSSPPEPVPVRRGKAKGKRNRRRGEPGAEVQPPPWLAPLDGAETLGPPTGPVPVDPFALGDDDVHGALASLGAITTSPSSSTPTSTEGGPAERTREGVEPPGSRHVEPAAREAVAAEERAPGAWFEPPEPPAEPGAWFEPPEADEEPAATATAAVPSVGLAPTPTAPPDHAPPDGDTTGALPVGAPDPAMALGADLLGPAAAAPAAAPKLSRRARRRAARPRVRRVVRIVRRIDAWSVFKISLLFFITAYLILLVAGVLLWSLAISTGTIDNAENFIQELFALDSFSFDGKQIFEASLFGGAVLVVAGTGMTVTLAVLFNLISDMVGGVRLTILEQEPPRRPAPRPRPEVAQPGPGR